WVGRRTLRVEDYGKVAATFVDTHTKRALRIIPRREARSMAAAFAPEARNKWEALRLGYQRMPDDLLLTVQVVTLAASIEWIVSRAGRRAACEICGEEIINEREIIRDGSVLCRACAGPAYYLIEAPAWSRTVEAQSPVVCHTA
ncbi:MAG TPA: FmdE family protein, partial [Anaerolineae bacterium]